MIKNKTYQALPFMLFFLIVGIVKTDGQTICKLKIFKGERVDNIVIGERIKKKHILRYGNYKIDHVVLPIKPRIKSYRRKIYLFDNGLTFSTTKKHIFHKFKISAIELIIPLQAETNEGIKLGVSSENDILKIYGKSEGKYDETHEIYFPGKEGKLVKYLSYETLGIRFYVDSVVYKIVVFKPEKNTNIN